VLENVYRPLAKISTGSFKKNPVPANLERPNGWSAGGEAEASRGAAGGAADADA